MCGYGLVPVQSSLWEQPLMCADSQTVLEMYLMESARDCVYNQQHRPWDPVLVNLLVQINLWGHAADLESLRPEKGLGSRLFFFQLGYAWLAEETPLC